MRLRRLLLAQLLWLVIACGKEQPKVREKLTIGVVSYGEGAQSIDQYARFRDHLAGQVGAIVEVEPAYNEIKAITQIEKKNWSLVFAPPGLAAIAISKAQYIPLFPLQSVGNPRSAIVVLKDSSIKSLLDLGGKTIALGQDGSATGYYLPVYDLYGLTLAEIKIASTPKAVLELVDRGEVVAGALSKDEFERLRGSFGQQRFRILHISELGIPPGAVLLSPNVDRNQQEQIVAAMKTASPTIVAEAGYIANAKVPDYQFMIKVVERVRPIVTRIRQKPAPLYEEGRGK